MPIVTVNFTLVSGAPKWTVIPDPVPVPPGLQALTWNLTGAPGAQFAANGIVPGNPAWPGADPKAVTAKQWSSPDHNTGAGKYKYSINVVYNGTTYPNDPQIENQPMGGKAEHDEHAHDREGRPKQ